MHSGFTRMAKIVVIPLHYPCPQILGDIDSILVSDYLHLFYHSLLEMTWIVLIFCLRSLSFACLAWISLRCTGKMFSSTGTNGNTASTSSTMSPCLGSLLSASATTFLGPLMYSISGSCGKSVIFPHLVGFHISLINY